MNWNFDVLPDFIFNGLSLGAIYGAVALSLVLIFKATTLINFATGELAMLGAFLVYVLHMEQGIWLWLSMAIAMGLSAGLGVLIERTLTRPFDPEDHLPVVLITLGLFLIINAVAGDIWNYQVFMHFGTNDIWNYQVFMHSDSISFRRCVSSSVSI